MGDLGSNEKTFHCSGNPSYWKTSYDNEEHLADHKSLNIPFNKEHDDFSSIYLHLINIRLWIKLKIEYHGYQSKTYWNTSYDNEENLADHKSLISSLNILLNKEHDDFSSLYWITKLHKNPYTEKNTTGASTFSTK